ncbi:MAG: GAF domain-containing protein [Bacteroidia bacterium]|nr:GAF domain-containing protein [Bacteroidia bacterium]
MISPPLRERILSEAAEILSRSFPLESRLQAVMQLLHEQIPHAHWVGIYWLHGQELVLGPYAGPPTEHTRIPVGRGVCGTAVAENQNQIVVDVREITNYLACNLETLSEIVVLIRHPESGEILGQIDVDGTAVGAFDSSDEALLQRIAEQIAQQVIAHRKYLH